MSFTYDEMWPQNEALSVQQNLYTYILVSERLVVCILMYSILISAKFAIDKTT